VLHLLALGLLTGAPAIPGAVLGAAVNNAELSAFLLGAIVHVVRQIIPGVRRPTSATLHPVTLAGVAVGLVIMYSTGLLVPA
jgi:hypothetical protein